MLFTYTYRGKQRSLDLPETASVKEFQQALVTKGAWRCVHRDELALMSVFGHLQNAYRWFVKR